MNDYYVSEMPDVYLFYGAKYDHFMAWDAAEKTYRVNCYPVNDIVA